MDDFEDEIDEFLDAGLGEIERKHDLQRRVAFGATVEFQAADPSSVLSLYMADRRRMAMQAIAELAYVDAENAIAVGTLQGAVREYLNVRDWVRQQVEAADDADMIMQGEDRGQEADDETDTIVRAPSRRNARARRRH